MRPCAHHRSASRVRRRNDKSDRGVPRQSTVVRTRPGRLRGPAVRRPKTIDLIKIRILADEGPLACIRELCGPPAAMSARLSGRSTPTSPHTSMTSATSGNACAVSSAVATCPYPASALFSTGFTSTNRPQPGEPPDWPVSSPVRHPPRNRGRVAPRPDASTRSIPPCGSSSSTMTTPTNSIPTTLSSTTWPIASLAQRGTVTATTTCLDSEPPLTCPPSSRRAHASSPARERLDALIRRQLR